MSELVQIEPKKIPPLHQSTETIMACPVFYVEAIIHRRRKPGGMESARGTQVHEVHSKYADSCAEKKVSMDLDTFDQLAKGAGPLAAKILSGMRDSYEVDWQHLLATEVSFSLDEDLRPTHVPSVAQSEVNDSRNDPAYQGTMDTLLAFRTQDKMQIDDAKTHPRPFDPDETLQGKMYSLFAFQHFPWVEEVKFRLVFVRYRNLTREVVYTRADVPKLIETVRAARARQELIHKMVEAGDPLEAIPGPHCVYCPLLANRKCPISEYNEQMQLTPVERLKFHLWYSAFSAANNKALKDYVQGTGRNVNLRDFNGKCYSYGPVPKESFQYPIFKKTADGIELDHLGRPVMPIIELLIDYAHSTPDDVKWMGNLLISSTKLTAPLGAKKRAFLDQAVTDTADPVTKTTLKASRPLETLEDDEPDEPTNEWGDEIEEF